MMLNLKKLTIFGIVASVFFSGIFCCCFSNTAQAEESVPSCHQTHETESSKNTEDCECDQTLAILEKESFKINPIEIVTLVSIKNQTGNETYFPIIKITNHDPPIIYDTIPLYIKHSVLRI